MRFQSHFPLSSEQIHPALSSAGPVVAFLSGTWAGQLGTVVPTGRRGVTHCGDPSPAGVAAGRQGLGRARVCRCWRRRVCSAAGPAALSLRRDLGQQLQSHWALLSGATGTRDCGCGCRGPWLRVLGTMAAGAGDRGLAPGRHPLPPHRDTPAGELCGQTDGLRCQEGQTRVTRALQGRAVLCVFPPEGAGLSPRFPT